MSYTKFQHALMTGVREQAKYIFSKTTKKGFPTPLRTRNFIKQI